MKIIITGGAGFIGSNLVDFLLKKNHQIVVIDDLSTGKIGNIKHFLNKIEFIEERLELINLDLLKDVDVVVHLAAQASVPLSINDFKNSSTTNLLSTINIFNYCRKNNIPVVYASSSAVYGELELGDDNKSKVDLLSPYAVDKYATEMYAEVAHTLYQLSSLGLRFFNVYGPRQDPSSPYSGVISIFIDRLLKKDSICINGGHQTRDFIYVNDVIRSIYKSMQIVRTGTVCEQINILTGKAISIDHLADMLSEQIGYKPQKIYKPLPDGDPAQSNGTTNKMTSMLGMDVLSMTSIITGLKQTIDFIKIAEV